MWRFWYKANLILTISSQLFSKLQPEAKSQYSKLHRLMKTHAERKTHAETDLH